MKITGKQLVLVLLALITALGIIIRFINFYDSVYFGFDEARDAYDSQNIYFQGGIKISGAPVFALKGINHSPLYLYILGPLFFQGQKDPYFVSIIFRLINTSGIIAFILQTRSAKDSHCHSNIPDQILIYNHQ